MSYNDISDKVDNLLAVNGIKPTNQAVADLAGVTESTVRNWKNGIREPKLGNLTALARGLNIPFTQLFEQIEDTISGPEVAFAKGEYETAEVVEEDWFYLKKSGPVKSRDQDI